jgi:hypothetical protein
MEHTHSPPFPILLLEHGIDIVGYAAAAVSQGIVLMARGWKNLYKRIR